MTPEREAYLAKCSEREKYLRKEIKDYKNEIRAIKGALQAGYDSEWNLGCLKFRKLWLTMFRHELARLKGMDRVCVPEVTADYPYTAYCKCGSVVGGYQYGSFWEDDYCRNCGRKLLWDKVVWVG